MGESTDDFLGKVTEDMDPIKRIASKIPGFAGYVERQTRRDADKLLRDTIASRFQELERKVSSLQKDFISQGEISYVDDLESAALKLRIFTDRIRTAARGYSGLFDAVKINEPELAKLYEYDSAMLSMTDEVERALDHVASSVGGEGLPAAIRNLVNSADQCVETFNKREEVVMTVGSHGTES